MIMDKPQRHETPDGHENSRRQFQRHQDQPRSCGVRQWRDGPLDTRGLGLDRSTILGLASVVGASRLMGLSPEQMVHAISITVGGNTAINQGRVGTLSNWKDFASAEASRKAIFSVQPLYRRLASSFRRPAPREWA
jgi:hypothetical protein